MTKLKIQVSKLKKITNKEISKIKNFSKSIGGYDINTIYGEVPNDYAEEVNFLLDEEYDENLFNLISSFLCSLQGMESMDKKEGEWYSYPIGEYSFSISKHNQERGFWNVQI